MNKYYKETITIVPSDLQSGGAEDAHLQCAVDFVPSDLQSGGAEGAHLQCAVDYKSTGTLPKAKMTARMATFIFHLSTFIFLSACTENSFTEEFSQQTNALHITSVTIDGQDVARTRVVADGGTFDGIPYNQSFNGFSEGDALQLVITNATPSTAYAIYNADGTWSITSDQAGNTPVTIVPDKDNDKKWADVSIEAAFGGEQITGETYPIVAPSMGIVQGDIPEESSIIYSDWLTASTGNGVTIDTDVKSPTLGATTIALKHVHALLRLPMSAASITAGNYIKDGTAYDVTDLGTLWAVVSTSSTTTYCPLTAVTIGEADYLQAIVPASTTTDTYTLTGFKAVMKVTDPSGASATSPDSGEESVTTVTLDLPFTVGSENSSPESGEVPEAEGSATASTGIALQPNTRYPLTLTIAPHRATVSLTDGLGKPGWSTEGEEELSNEMNEALVIDGANATDVDAVKAEIEAAIAKGVSTIVVTGTTLAADATGSSANTIVGEAISQLGTTLSLVLTEVTEIGEQAFFGCDALTSVSLPAATTIGKLAFSDCTALTNVTADKAETIGNYAFFNCSALYSVSIDAAKMIASGAFSGCSALKSVELPSATSIGNRAFCNCASLTSLTLGVVKSVATDSFLNVTTTNCDLTLGTGSTGNPEAGENKTWAGMTWKSITLQ